MDILEQQSPIIFVLIPVFNHFYSLRETTGNPLDGSIAMHCDRE